MLFSQLCQDLLGDGLRFLSPGLHVVELLQYSFVRRVCEVVVDGGLHPVRRVLACDQGADDAVVVGDIRMKYHLPVTVAFGGLFYVDGHGDEALSETVVRDSEQLGL